MNISQFQTRFILTLPRYQPSESHLLPEAAVLIALVGHNDPVLLMTRRAAHLRHHPGQVSFPGGKREPDDGSLVDTALRESHEEEGIDSAQIDVFGQLSPVKSRSGFQVTPVIGRLVTRGRFSPDPQEVAHVFEIPLRLLSARENFIRLHLTTERQEVWFLRYRDELIWGITAEILYQLATQLFPDHSPPGHQNVTCLTMSNKSPLTPSMVVE